MDRLAANEEFEREVQATMRERGIDYGKAEVIVAMKRGELHGCLLSIHPLADEQRRKRRMTLIETMIELGEITEAEGEALLSPPSDRHASKQTAWSHDGAGL